MPKLSKPLTGIAGEYLVAAELTLQGYIASITLRNSEAVDILASNQTATRQVAIQVKTNQYGQRYWLLGKKAEELFSDTLFYVFVSLKGDSTRPEYFIVPSGEVAEYIRKSHQDWLGSPGRGGRARKDSSMRKFADELGIYQEKWELLGLYTA